MADRDDLHLLDQRPPRPVFSLLPSSVDDQHAHSHRSPPLSPVVHKFMVMMDGESSLQKDGGHTEVAMEMSPYEHSRSVEQLAPASYRVYKRRFFGLASLILLNIIVSWSWLTFSAVSTTSAEFFGVTVADINWLSTGFLFAFLVAAPPTLYVLNKYPPKVAIIICSILILVGSWLRYAGTRTSTPNFPLVILGHILLGLSQSFVLAAPTRYSDAWFSDRGRVSATACASLANPLGGALGQLLGPIWAPTAAGVPSLVLYTSIIATVFCVPSFFLPGLPPTPPTNSTASRPAHQSIREGLRALVRNKQFWLLSFPFVVYIGAFNATASLVDSILAPYGFSETQAGVAGAVLIVAGLVFSAVLSPLIDRTKAYLISIKLLAPLIAVMYVAAIFVPGTRSFATVCAIFALLGMGSFGLLPCALEYLAEITYPVSPELSSVIVWAGGQAMGGVMIIVMDALEGASGQPADSFLRGLIFQAVLAVAALPAALLLGMGKGMKGKLGRTGSGRQ